MTDIATALSDQGIRLRDYDLDEHKVTCPRCSAQRKKKHEPCLNVRPDADDRAVWQCWHAGIATTRSPPQTPRRDRRQSTRAAPSAQTEPDFDDPLDDLFGGSPA